MITQAFNAPNLITLVRVLLAPVAVVAILKERPTTALTVFAIAAATDFLDGLLARATGASTRTGQYLDPIADKVLLCAVYVALWVARTVPGWFVAVVFGRDAALLLGSAIAMRFTTYDNYRPTLWGKISTFWQIAAAVTAMSADAMGARKSNLVRYAVYVAAAFTLWSAAHYAWRGMTFFRRLNTTGERILSVNR